MKNDPPASGKILGRVRRNQLEGLSSSNASVAEPVPLLVELWRVVDARKWLILGCMVAAILAAIIVVRQLTPVYRSTATLLIEQGRNRVVSIEEVYSPGVGTREHLMTQAEFLKSRNVADRVIKKLNLTEHPAFARSVAAEQNALSSARRWVKNLVLGESPQESSEANTVEASILQAFDKALDVQPVRLSQLISVSFESSDRKLAANVANTVAAAYVEADLDARFAVAAQANSWLGERVATLRQNLTASEQALQAFRERKGVIDRQSAAQGGSARQLEEATQRLVDARVRRVQAEQAYNLASSSGGDPGGLLLNNTTVARAHEARLEARRKLADAAQRLGASHPQYQLADTELAQAERNLKQATDSAIVVLRREYEIARATERQLEQTIASTRGAIQGQNREEFELTSYERDVATNRQLYETFLARLRETSAASGLQSPVARIVDSAVPSVVPARPSKPLILLVSGLLGLGVGIAVALALHRLDRTIRTVDAAESRLHAPVLTALPQLSAAEAAKAGTMMLADPHTGFSEGIRSLRTALLLSAVDQQSRTVLVTSAIAGEGKSTVSMNLALAHSQISKTLLIEADMRRPTHAAQFGLAHDAAGLRELISGTATLQGCVQNVPHSNLHVITSGSPSSTPLELLSTSRFQAILERLRAEYETVVIDSPPVGVVSDAALLASRATSIVFVVRAESTPYRVAAHALKKLASQGLEVLGLVVNGLNFERAHRYYGDAASHSARSYAAYSGAPRNEAKA
jgi:capsular exopolysaccharide synthesis family protein